MDVRGLDPATAKLAIELQLADVNAILAGTDTKAADHMAFETLKESLLHTLQLLTGQVLAMTVLRADHDNLVVFQGLVREERQAAQDHDIARDLGGLVTEQPSSLGPEHHSKDQESWLSNDDAVFPYYASIAGIPEESTIATPNKSQSIFPCGQELSKLNVFAESRAEASDSANQRYSKGKRKADEHITHTLCSSCMDRHPRFDVIELGCKRKGDVAYHAYCRSCLVGLFKSSLTDTTLFPPRCCGIRIPLSACVHLCPLELVKQYEDKEIELASPNPVYCSNRFCAEFIKPGNVVADIATCRTCKTETCTICKNPRHKGLCPEDPTVQMLMEVAGEKRWQRCHKCRTMVELVVGCYHMRCRCGGEFCYLCAKPWRTCSCSQWDEHRLLANGQALDAPPNQIAMPEEIEVPEVDPTLEILDDLRLRVATVAGGFAINNEEEPGGAETPAISVCPHQWERLYGEHGEREVCGICRDHLRFVNNCTMCRTKVCNRCLNNRL